MKLKTLFTFILIGFFSVNLYSQSQVKTPLEFNDAMANIISDLYSKGTAWGTKFNEVRNGDKKYSDLTATRIEMEKYIDDKIAELKKMKDINGSQDYRQAMINFLGFEKNMIQTGFIPLEKLTANSSDKEVDNALTRLTDEAKKENGELDKMRKVQQAYASKNNFTIESKKSE